MVLCEFPGGDKKIDGGQSILGLGNSTHPVQQWCQRLALLERRADRLAASWKRRPFAISVRRRTLIAFRMARGSDRLPPSLVSAVLSNNESLALSTGGTAGSGRAARDMYL